MDWINYTAIIIAVFSLLLNLRVFVTPEMMDRKLEHYRTKDHCESKHDSVENTLQEILNRLQRLTDYLLDRKGG